MDLAQIVVRQVPFVRPPQLAAQRRAQHLRVHRQILVAQLQHGFVHRCPHPLVVALQLGAQQLHGRGRALLFEHVDQLLSHLGIPPLVPQQFLDLRQILTNALYQRVDSVPAGQRVTQLGHQIGDQLRGHDPCRGADGAHLHLDAFIVEQRQQRMIETGHLQRLQHPHSLQAGLWLWVLEQRLQVRDGVQKAVQPGVLDQSQHGRPSNPRASIVQKRKHPRNSL